MYAWTLYTPIHDFICYALNPFDIFKSFNIYIYIYIQVLHRFMCIHQYYNVYSYRRIWVMYTTRRLGKYLKVHPRSGTRTGMSNDDHLLVPVVNIAPDCQYTQENVTC